MQNPVVWKLRSGADRRFRGGHPWAYSNELLESPKGLEAGAEVELRDETDRFLARGYGNPHSLIAFRAVSRDPGEGDALEREGIVRRLAEAFALRAALGFRGVSHRACFGEADRLPGLVIDRYLLAENQGQVFVIQAHTAGMDRRMADVVAALETIVTRDSGGIAWERTGVLVRNDVGVRKLEGLSESEPKVWREIPGLSFDRLRDAAILVPSASGEAPVVFRCDLVEGQKTGFFLDQSANVAMVARLLRDWPKTEGKAELRILDLCSYVGQWSSQLSGFFAARGVKCHVTQVDASQTALSFAKRNAEARGAVCETIVGDVLRDLGALQDSSFDLVICDPPALIKGRKDIPAGTHAYLQVNTQAFRLVRPGGAIVTCSCSALLEEEEFVRALSKAAYRNRRKVRWVARGGQAPDHPVLAEFPEGRYLKAFLGVIEHG